MRSTAHFALASALGAIVASVAMIQFWDRPSAAEAESPSLQSEFSKRSGPSSSDHQAGSLNGSIEALSAILDQEIRERHALAEDLDRLRGDFQELNQNLKSRVEQAFQEDRATQSAQTETNEQQSSEDRLIAAGFTQEQMASFERLEAEDQMRQIELDDRARREGWVNSQRYYEELQALGSQNSSVRSVIGDAAYDRYLFARGRPNRLTVQTVIAESPAQKAGFRRGDIIVAYGNEKIFSSQELTSSRSSGVLGEQVAVHIIRDGQHLQLSIPRGPMGVTTGATAVDPTAIAE